MLNITVSQSLFKITSLYLLGVSGFITMCTWFVGLIWVQPDWATKLSPHFLIRKCPGLKLLGPAHLWFTWWIELLICESEIQSAIICVVDPGDLPMDEESFRRKNRSICTLNVL